MNIDYLKLLIYEAYDNDEITYGEKEYLFEKLTDIFKKKETYTYEPDKEAKNTMGGVLGNCTIIDNDNLFETIPGIKTYIKTAWNISKEEFYDFIEENYDKWYGDVDNYKSVYPSKAQVKSLVIKLLDTIILKERGNNIDITFWVANNCSKESKHLFGNHSISNTIRVNTKTEKYSVSNKTSM